MHVSPSLVALALCAPFAACAPARVAIDFTIPDDKPALGVKFLATPWPSDVMLTDTGLDLSTVPDPFHSGTEEDAIQLIATNKHYAATGALYFHVDGGVDESSLPKDAAESLLQGTAMFIAQVEPAFSSVDAKKPDRVLLQGVPAIWQQYQDGNSFLPKDTMAVMPILGAVPKGPFALIVTSNARSPSGAALGPSPDLLALMRCDPERAGARKVDCTPYQQIVRALGVPPEDVALIQLVTPEDATSGLVNAAKVVRQLPPPAVTNLSKRGDTTNYTIFDGTVHIAELQAGVAPYAALDRENNYASGGFQTDAHGDTVVQRFADVPFVITVPHTPPQSPSGYCSVIYGHGTGGDLDSGIDDGSADQLALAGCAMIGMSEPLHRTREGFSDGETEQTVEILTFNFFNPVAGRDNWRESAIEKVQLVSMAQSLSIPASVTGSAGVVLDPERVSYFGHSQGGIAGALFVAIEPRIRGAFLSGAGAGFGASLVLKTDPPPAIADVLKTALSYPGDSSEEIDLFHPVIALLQTFIDPADPINYGDLWRERGGNVPSLVMTSGQKDTFTPPVCHGALAASWRLPLVEPISNDVEVLDVLGIAPVPGPVSGNITTALGEHITAGVLQYPKDGHFAVFDNPDAQSALRQFFATLQTGVPTVQVTP
ncbi:MAG TPA: alpha/beta hydrolase [Myxococcota bacterium]